MDELTAPRVAIDSVRTPRGAAAPLHLIENLFDGGEAPLSAIKQRAFPGEHISLRVPPCSIIGKRKLGDYKEKSVALCMRDPGGAIAAAVSAAAMHDEDNRIARIPPQRSIVQNSDRTIARPIGACEKEDAGTGRESR
jgi:hypothetical protein